MNNIIHPTAFIEEGVEIGQGNYFGPYCYIDQGVEIGDNNYFESHCVIGGAPQLRDLKKMAGLWIGDGNMFRSHVTIHRGTDRNTVIGRDNMLMAGSHVAHDVLIENNTTIAGGVMIAGFSVIMTHSTLGSNSSVHQYSVIGSYAMIGQNTSVDQHVEVMAKVYGVPARYLGMNDKIRERLHLTDEELDMAIDRFHEYSTNMYGKKRTTFSRANKDLS